MIHNRRAAHQALKRAAAPPVTQEAAAPEEAPDLHVRVVPCRTDGARKLYHSETSKYEQPLALVASGGFRKVYAAWHARTNSVVVLRAEAMPTRARAAAALRTARLEQQAGGRFAPLRFFEERPGVVRQLLGEHASFVIVSPLAESELGLSLEALHQLPSPQRRATVRYAAEQILLDLHRLHRERQLLHNDIKPSNCLVAGDGSVHVHDFNLSLGKDQPRERRLMGTPPFVAPELYAASDAREPVPYSEGSDMYAMGLTLRLVAAPSLGHRAAGQGAMDQEACWEDDAVSMLGPQSRALLRDTVSLDPNRRPSAKEFAESLCLTAEERAQGAAFFATQHHLGDRAREALRSSTRAPLDPKLQRWAELETHWHISGSIEP